MEDDKIHGQAQFWKKCKADELAEQLKAIATDEGLIAERVAFVCIGTDRSTGDALGPLVGSRLAELGYKSVVGTLEAPCDASNLPQRLAEIPAGVTVIAVDACLGQKLSVGMYQLSNQPIAPGKSVGKVLPQVGDYTIAAIVNADGPRQYSVLQTTSLYHVMQMAEDVVRAIVNAFPLQEG
ncbi:spore protease YyaC [Paenibacillus ferrarius]|uniref:spore protease YyaC n=1 Tax=Paenibacillus ferrarius TaxID=1469647 RepID=UPI003D2E1143